jgi:DNA polymerase III epsilon subunit-like protein
MSLLIVDVETTGLDVSVHSCIELGAILLDDDLNILGEFGTLIRPSEEIFISAEAMKVNKISLEELSLAPTAEAVVTELMDLILNVPNLPTLAGWNVWFDAAFMKALFKTAKIDWPFSHRLIDIQSIAAYFGGLKPASQAETVRRILHENQKHRALDDARLIRHFRSIEQQR